MSIPDTPVRRSPPAGAEPTLDELVALMTGIVMRIETGMSDAALEREKWGDAYGLTPEQQVGLLAMRRNAEWLRAHLPELLAARDALAAAQRDARLWRGLMASQRVRLVGAERVGGAAYIGLELWTTYPDFPAGDDAGERAVLEKYVELALAATPPVEVPDAGT